jgi:hypothetical protein
VPQPPERLQQAHDQWSEVIDPDAPAGDVVPPLADLLLTMARRRLAVEAQTNQESPQERE